MASAPSLASVPSGELSSIARMRATAAGSVATATPFPVRNPLVAGSLAGAAPAVLGAAWDESGGGGPKGARNPALSMHEARKAMGDGTEPEPPAPPSVGSARSTSGELANNAAARARASALTTTVAPLPVLNMGAPRRRRQDACRLWNQKNHARSAVFSVQNCSDHWYRLSLVCLGQISVKVSVPVHFCAKKWRSASSPSCWRARCPWRRRRLNRMRPGSSLRSAVTTAASETTAASPFRRRRRACAVERIHTACADRRAAARWAPRASRAVTSGSARKHRTSRAQASAASVATTSCASACTTRRTTITILPRPSRRCCSC